MTVPCHRLPSTVSIDWLYGPWTAPSEAGAGTETGSVGLALCDPTTPLGTDGILHILDEVLALIDVEDMDDSLPTVSVSTRTNRKRMLYQQ